MWTSEDLQEHRAVPSFCGTLCGRVRNLALSLSLSLYLRIYICVCNFQLSRREWMNWEHQCDANAERELPFQCSVADALCESVCVRHAHDGKRNAFILGCLTPSLPLSLYIVLTLSLRLPSPSEGASYRLLRNYASYHPWSWPPCLQFCGLPLSIFL